MARDDQSNGNGSNQASSGKSGRQDSSLSARRARLRSLARQALPADPYSKKQDENQADPAASLELEPMDKSDEGGSESENNTAASVPVAGPAPSLPPPSLQMPYDYVNLENQSQSRTQPIVQQTSLTPSSSEAIPNPFAQLPEPGFGNQEYKGYSQQAGSDFSQSTLASPVPVPDLHQPPGPSYTPPSADIDLFSTSSPIDDMFGDLDEQTSAAPAEPKADNSLNQAMAPLLGGPPGFFNTTAPSSKPAFDLSSYQESIEAEAGPTAEATQNAAAALEQLGDPVAAAAAAVSSAIFDPFDPAENATAENATAENAGAENAGADTADFETVKTDADAPSEQSSPTSSTESMFTDEDYKSDTGDSDSQSSPDPLSPSRSEEPEKAEKEPEPESAKELQKSPVEEKSKPEPAATPPRSRRSRRKGSAASEEESKETETQPDDELSEELPSAKNKSVEEEKTAEILWKTPGKETEPKKSDVEDIVDGKQSETEDKQSHSKQESDEESDREDKQPEPLEVKDKEKKDKEETVTSRLPEGDVLPPPPVVSAHHVEVLTKSQAEALELLTSIDQALGICAMNLSSLQSTASEQTEALKTLRETLQNQTFFELGLNLNTLMESMSAALEPMKAVGELVPAIDQLVTTMVGKEEQEKETRLSPDRLVTALADQLGAGQIDPWTFKCAYMAVYPDEHPADLLHRLVDLLGTQRLSGELFRAAYDAVQAAEPVKPATESSIREVIKVVQDEEVLKQLEELRRANEELRTVNEELRNSNTDLRSTNDDLKGSNDELRSSLEDLRTAVEARAADGSVDEAEIMRRLDEREQEFTRRMEEREAEVAELLAAKEQEIQDTQEMLHSRFEEFNSRYEEIVETVNQRDEEIKAKDDEVTRKESEIAQLKAQLDEIKEQFKETVEDMQKQLSTSQKMAQEASKQAAASQAVAQAAPAAPAAPEEKAKPTSGFFDAEPKSSFLDGGPSRPLFKQQMDTFNSMSKPPVAPGAGGPPTPGNEPPTPPASFSSPPTQPLPEPSNQAVPKPPQTSGMGPLTGSGSYGSGVRAQVFEVIVRQALAGAPWREICAGPMQVNNISADEVEAEVKRREALLKK